MPFLPLMLTFLEHIRGRPEFRFPKILADFRFQLLSHFRFPKVPISGTFVISDRPLERISIFLSPISTFFAAYLVNYFKFLQPKNPILFLLFFL